MVTWHTELSDEPMEYMRASGKGKISEKFSERWKQFCTVVQHPMATRYTD